MAAGVATHMVSPWENCDTLSRLSLKTHKRMNFCRSFAAAIVVCGAASSLAAPVSAQVVENILQDATGVAKNAGGYAEGQRHLLGANRNPVANFAQRQHLELQRARAVRIGAPSIRISRPSFGF
jgi:hypothetical protein